MVKIMLNGNTATVLFTSILPDTTRSVMQTDPIVNTQLARARESINDCAIVDRLISAVSIRDPV